MLHNDALAQEFDDTLRLTPYYDPVRLAPSARELTLYAPLTTSVSPLAGGDVSFLRNSEAIYRAPSRGALLMAADDESRHEYTPEDGGLGFLSEYAITNKNINYNANPDAALSGFVFTGDPAAVLSRVQDPQRLNDAGLSAICTSGYVFKYDNSAGLTDAACYVSGGTGESGDLHALSIWGRKDPSSVNRTFLRLEAETQEEFTNTEAFERIVHLGFSVQSRRLGVLLEAGSMAYFVLNQLEEARVPSSPIVVAGGAVSRSVDQLQYSLISTPSGDPILNQAEGMHAMLWRPSFTKDDILAADDTQYLTSMDTALLFFQNTGLNGEFRARSGASVDIEIGLPSPLAQQSYVVAMRWNGADWTVGTKTQGVWYWRAMAANFAGLNESGFLNVSDFIVGSPLGPANCRKLAIWNKDLGQQALEDFYAGDAN